MSTKFATQKRAIIAAVMAVILLVGLMVPTVSAYAEPTSAEKRAEAQQVLSQLEEMQVKLDEASNNYYAALEAQEEAEAKVVEAQAKVDEKTKEIEGYQEQLGDRARDMYRSGSVSFVDVILGASSFEEFATTWNMLEKLNENDAELVQQTKDAREELEAAKTEAEEQAQIAADKTAEAEAVKEEAEATTAEMQATYDQLSAEAEELLRQEEEAAERARQAAAQAALQNQSGGGNYDNNKTPTVTGNVIVDRMLSWVSLMCGVLLVLIPLTVQDWSAIASQAHMVTIGALPIPCEIGRAFLILSQVISVSTVIIRVCISVTGK